MRHQLYMTHVAKLWESLDFRATPTSETSFSPTTHYHSQEIIRSVRLMVRHRRICCRSMCPAATAGTSSTLPLLAQGSAARIFLTPQLVLYHGLNMSVFVFVQLGVHITTVEATYDFAGLFYPQRVHQSFTSNAFSCRT